MVGSINPHGKLEYILNKENSEKMLQFPWESSAKKTEMLYQEKKPIKKRKLSNLKKLYLKAFSTLNPNALEKTIFSAHLSAIPPRDYVPIWVKESTKWLRLKNQRQTDVRKH